MSACDDPYQISPVTVGRTEHNRKSREHGRVQAGCYAYIHYLGLDGSFAAPTSFPTFYLAFSDYGNGQTTDTGPDDTNRASGVHSVVFARCCVSCRAGVEIYMWRTALYTGTVKFGYGSRPCGEAQKEKQSHLSGSVSASGIVAALYDQFSNDHG